MKFFIIRSSKDLLQVVEYLNPTPHSTPYDRYVFSAGNSQWNINNAKAISLGFSLPVFTKKQKK